MDLDGVVKGALKPSTPKVQFTFRCPQGIKACFDDEVKRTGADREKVLVGLIEMATAHLEKMVD